ncbi:MAG: amidohydrolase [Bacilli bacterium]|jgi:amidohydrolase|nr:amidohydrolase [Bacilli bacterium]
MKNIEKEISDVKTYLLDLRKFFHQHAEISGMEEVTSKRIRQELAKMNIEYEIVNDYSIIAFINRDKDKKCIAFRNGIDALSIEDNSDYPYKSLNKNVSHAIGNDICTAANLSILKILKKYEKSLNGTVIFIFESKGLGSEGPNEIINSNILKNIDYLYYIVNLPQIKIGQYTLGSGLKLVGSNTLLFKWQGCENNNFDTFENNDSVLASASFALNIRNMLARNLNQAEIYNIVITRFNSGGYYNIIPNYCELSLNLRYANLDVKKKMHKIIKDYVHVLENQYEVKVEVTSIADVPPLYNDEEAIALARKSALKLVNKAAISNFSPITSSDPFSFYARKYKVAGIAYGSGEQDKKQHMYYTDKFNPSEKSFDYLLKLVLTIITDYLA